MSDQSNVEVEREEQQDALTAYRKDDRIVLKHHESDAVIEGTLEDYEEFLEEIKRTKWLLRDEDALESESTVTGPPGAASKADCHECGFHGYAVENEIGTVYCPKCRSTNVGWKNRGL